MRQAQKLQDAIREKLVEADDIYILMIEAGESPNIDSDGYTSQMMLDHFRRLLGQPDLREEELQNILRQASAAVRDVLGPRPHTRVPKPVMAPDPDRNWSELMARFIVNRTNENDRTEKDLQITNRRIG